MHKFFFDKFAINEEGISGKDVFTTFHASQAYLIARQKSVKLSHMHCSNISCMCKLFNDKLRINVEGISKKTLIE